MGKPARILFLLYNWEIARRGYIKADRIWV